ncbi:type VI secretion system PAAR protein [Plesiomonas shigelloides]|uniref:type VI secretion system PAAR protein n=1 Tax=Plesiomonas shigelloides TaxID=703 RepID=UPI0012628827|nr:type VI secretion system PAAR protein [Plesiomonas shigelloides]KAB7669754.1 type VI secretion system PAAR protein [Plesiomonas shigelloides]KAB7692334.1 type VI secretion system PAAR protein [Plesiomonas shigelloides]
MSKKAATIGDIGTDHDGFPPTPIIEGSQDIIIDSKPAARVGDALEPHAKPGSPPHDRAITTGSTTVFFNGKPAALTGSKVGCGGVIIGGSSVIIGDMAPSVATPLNLASLFDEHFCIMDCETDAPFEHLAYGMTSSKGLVEGMVDANGKTSKVKGETEDNLTLDYVFQTKIGLR